MHSKISQQSMAAKGGRTQWRRLGQQGGRQKGWATARGLAGEGGGVDAGGAEVGDKEGGRVMRRGSAEATVARLAIRGGLAVTAAGEGTPALNNINACARSNFC